MQRGVYGKGLKVNQTERSNFNLKNSKPTLYLCVCDVLLSAYGADFSFWALEQILMRPGILGMGSVVSRERDLGQTQTNFLSFCSIRMFSAGVRFYIYDSVWRDSTVALNHQNKLHVCRVVDTVIGTLVNVTTCLYYSTV